MDERELQLKLLKKEYKRLRRRAGLCWRIFGHSFMLLFVICTVITVFVCFQEAGWVQFVSGHIWQPVKAALKLPLPYDRIWCLARDYGLVICIATGIPALIFLLIGGVCKRRAKLSDTYRNYRTLRLTLETEKEENR